MNKFFGHLHTIGMHRRLVRKYCFKLGLFWQGLTHDLSKYSLTEFVPGIKYYTGDHSPHLAARKALGYSEAWMHHKGRNRHHFEYWTDYVGENHAMAGVMMPPKYFAEMFCDRIAASRIYNRGHYEDHMPLDYFLHSKSHEAMNPELSALLEKVLTIVSEQGEEAGFAYVKKEILKR